MVLSDLAVRKAAPRERPYKLADGGGLHVLVQPNGAKYWRLKFRYAGKEKLLSFGRYPVITLADARSRREQAKKLLAAGIDPSHQKKLNKIAVVAAAQNTFGAVAA